MKILAILAGGKGERLRPLTETRPKPLMPILGEPIICRHLRMASKHGSYDSIVILASYMKDRVREGVEECGFDVEIVDQGRELGTGHAILRVMEAVGPGEYTVIYSDVYLHEGYYEVLSKARTPAVLAGMTDRPSEYGVIQVEDGRLKGVVEKPKEAPGQEAWVFIGGLKLSYDEAIGYLRSLTPSPRGEYEVTDALTMMASDYEVEVARGSPEWPWLDIGRPWDLLVANRLALESAEFRGGVYGDVDGRASVEGKVYIGEGARVEAYSVVEGPAYIGEEARVGPNAHIRPYTVMLRGSKAGFSTQVKASILMEHSKAPHLNYVGDSILGEHVNLGAGTITANLRFDDKPVKMTVKGVRVDTGMRKLGAVVGGYTKTGINVSIMPGVKIGAHAVIWPGCVVNRDVGSGEVYKCS